MDHMGPQHAEVIKQQVHIEPVQLLHAADTILSPHLLLIIHTCVQIRVHHLRLLRLTIHYYHLYPASQ